MKAKLNIGSGKRYKEGWVNLDKNSFYKRDVKHDLNEYPYPFTDDTFVEIECFMILEHIDDVERCLKELIRISKHKGVINILVPHSTSYSNLGAFDHKGNFTENSFNEVLLEEKGLMSLSLIHREFRFHSEYKRYIPFKKYLRIYFNGIYDDIEFKFEVNKDGN